MVLVHPSQLGIFHDSIGTSTAILCTPANPFHTGHPLWPVPPDRSPVTTIPTPSRRKLPKFPAGSPSRGVSHLRTPPAVAEGGNKGRSVFSSSTQVPVWCPAWFPNCRRSSAGADAVVWGQNAARGSSAEQQLQQSSWNRAGPARPAGSLSIDGLTGDEIFRRIKNLEEVEIKVKKKTSKNSLIWPWSANCHWDSS